MLDSSDCTAESDPAPLGRGSPSPARGALRRLRGNLESFLTDPSRDQRFMKLLWEPRPRLVCAVALWGELKGLHPELCRRLVLEPRYEAGRKLFEAASHEGRWPDAEVLVALLVKEIGPARELMERHGRMLLQILCLGWGYWWPKEDNELSRTPGGLLRFSFWRFHN